MEGGWSFFFGESTFGRLSVIGSSCDLTYEAGYRPAPIPLLQLSSKRRRFSCHRKRPPRSRG